MIEVITVVLLSEFNTVCKQYNKLAQVLITFETLWYTQWKANVESVKGGITMNVLAYNPHDGTIIVNSDSGYQKFSLQLFFLSWLGKLVRIMQKNDFMLTWGKWCRKYLCSSWLQKRFLFERNQTATTFSALKKSNTWREKLENVGFSLKISMNNHQTFFILGKYLLSVKRELCFLKLTLSFICFIFFGAKWNMCLQICVFAGSTRFCKKPNTCSACEWNSQNQRWGFWTTRRDTKTTNPDWTVLSVISMTSETWSPPRWAICSRHMCTWWFPYSHPDGSPSHGTAWTSMHISTR